jgi:acyl-CoA dehydrogenase
VGITVEGANILTRSLMVFGQGAIRAHPYLLDEIRALGNPDPQQALVQFDDKLWRHVGHFLRTALRATMRSWTGGLFAPAPARAGKARRFYRQLSRYSAAFAFLSDIAFLTLGGELKRRELLSARFGDILSELYLASAALKRWHDEGQQKADFPLLHYAMETGFATIEQRFDEILANLPFAPLRATLRFFIMPFGRRRRGPSDRLIRQVADLLLTPSATRDRLTSGLYFGSEDEAVGQLGRAFALVDQTQPIRDRLRKAGHKDWHAAKAKGLVSDEESAGLEAADAAVAKVIAVDDFAADELTHHDVGYREAAE